MIGEDGAKWGAYEKTAFIVDGKYWVNNHAHVLKPYDANDVFLENYLTMIDLGPYITGDAPPKLTLGNLQEIHVPMPSVIGEQQKIADLISSINELITAQMQKIESFKAHKKGILQQLFPTGGESLPELRFPEYAVAGWEVKPLGKICNILNNRRKPITSSERTKGPYPYYGASGIVDYVNDFIFDERLLLIGEDGAKWGAYEKTAFIVDGKYWVNNHAHVLKPYDANDIFLENYLTMIDLGPYITGNAPPKLTLGNLQEIHVPMPSVIGEQQKIADLLSSTNELITAQMQKIESLKAHKKGLIQKLFPAVYEVGV